MADGEAGEAAPAKVNLYLHVTGRRPDLYHELDSLVCFAGAADRLSAAPAETITLTVSGRFGKMLAAETSNLVLRAAERLAGFAPVPMGAAMRLEKNLPIAAGLGGGSADAAAALRLLSRLWRLPDYAAGHVAPSLGADVPVCLAGQTARMRGIGEKLTPVNLPPFGLVLVNPGHAVPTGLVFRAFHESGTGFSAPVALPALADAAELAAFLRGTANDLEAPARALCPPIDEVLRAIGATADCLLARMSGSGATCFGLYPDAAAAAAAARRLAREGWWCWPDDRTP